MKNKEKYVDDIIAIASNGYNIAVRRVYEQVVGCEATDCRDCVFLEGNCAENRQKWFESEAYPTIDELKSELETLKKERDELRARLEKAVELPVKVGDTIYCIRNWGKGRYKVEEHTVIEIVFEHNNQMRIKTSCGLFGCEKWTFGLDCFADNAEAEARLKSCREGRDDKPQN